MNTRFLHIKKIFHIPRVSSFTYGSAVIHAVRTSGEKFISSLPVLPKKRKVRESLTELGGRELTYLSPDVLTAYILAGPWNIPLTNIQIIEGVPKRLTFGLFNPKTTTPALSPSK